MPVAPGHCERQAEERVRSFVPHAAEHAGVKRIDVRICLRAAVFKVLWEFGGEPQEAHVIMSRAVLTSDKPIEVFKVKAQHKGDPRYEGPLRAYKALVKANQRAGTCAMAPGAMGRALGRSEATSS